MVFFSFASLVLLFTSLPWVAAFRPPNKTAWLMAFYLVSSANMVLAGCIASSFHLLNQRWFMLAIHVLVGGIGFLFWKRFGKFSLWGPFQGWQPKFEVQWLRRKPLLVLLILLIALSYAFALAQVIYIPQNNSDGLSTHLSRIVFWRQHGSFFPWQTLMLTQIWYPVNAQLQTYWTLLFLGGDQLAGSIQWLSALVSALGVYGVARLLGHGSRGSAFAALIFLSFPLIALQSTTTQTDLVTAAFFIPAVYFLILGLRDGQISLLSLSAMSVGLGIGVKKSYFLLLPVLAVVALLAAFQYGRHSLKKILLWSLNLVVATALLGAYSYVMNWWNFGDPFGSPAYLDLLIEIPQSQVSTIRGMPSLISVTQNDTPHPSALAVDTPAPAGMVMELVYNMPRLLYQALDTSGLPNPLDGYAHKIKMRVARAFFQAIGFREIEGKAYTAPGHVFSFSDKNVNEESQAWYGPLSVLLIFPALLVGIRRGWRQHSYLLGGPAIAILIFLPLEIILRPGWDPYQGRYFVPLVALSAPLAAMWFKEKGNPFYEWLISGLAVLIMGVTLLYNPSKPTLGKYADDLHVWNNDRIIVQTIQRKKDRETYFRVEKFVPADSTLGYYIPFFILDYPLFGENLTRRLVPMISTTQISDIQWLRQHDIDYLLLPQKNKYPLPPLEYQLISSWPGWRLYAYTPSP